LKEQSAFEWLKILHVVMVEETPQSSFIGGR